MLGLNLDSALLLLAKGKRILLRIGALFLSVWVAASALPLFDPSQFSNPTAIAFFSDSLSDRLLVWSEHAFLPAGETIIALGPWDAWTVLMEVGAVVALLVTLPYATWLLFSRARRGMKRRERRAFLRLLPLSVGLFVAGVAVAALVLPWLYWFAFALQGPAGVSGTISLTSFVTETALFLVLMGLAFETPVLTYALGYFGVLTTAMMRRSMKWAFLACALAALFVSPGVGGGIIEIPLAFGLFGLYLLGYAMVRRTERVRAAARDRTEATAA